jgi:hypothetical protein
MGDGTARRDMHHSESLFSRTKYRLMWRSHHNGPLSYPPLTTHTAKLHQRVALGPALRVADDLASSRKLGQTKVPHVIVSVRSGTQLDPPHLG